MRLIDADKLKEATKSFTDCDGFNPVWQIIDNAPTVDLNTKLSVAYLKGRRQGQSEARPTASWIHITGDVCECSNCRDREIPMSMMSCTYCPSCGAKMEVPDENQI